MRYKSFITKLTAIVICVILMITLSGCFASKQITLATLDTPEAVLASEIMARQLENFGFEVVRGITYSSLAELEAGMRGNEFDLSAVFLQDALTGFDIIGESPVYDQQLATEIVNNTLHDVLGYVLLDWWSIDAQYTLAVRDNFIQGDLAGLGSLAFRAPGLTLAATEGFIDSALGMDHLRNLFWEIEFGNIVVVGYDDLFEPGNIDADVIALRSTFVGDWLVNAGYTSIGQSSSRVDPVGFDGFAIWPQNNLVPVASDDLMERLPEVQAILSSVSFQIDPSTFARHLRHINVGSQTPEQAAYEILQHRR